MLHFPEFGNVVFTDFPKLAVVEDVPRQIVLEMLLS